MIAATVRNALTQGCQRVILVDNDSPDDTVDLAIAAGAELGATFSTPQLDELLKIRLLNETVARVSEESPHDHIWWLWLDADEFVHGPGGSTVGEMLTTLDRRFRIVGTRYFNHYPDRRPEHLVGTPPDRLPGVVRGALGEPVRPRPSQAQPPALGPPRTTDHVGARLPRRPRRRHARRADDRHVHAPLPLSARGGNAAAVRRVVRPRRRWAVTRRSLRPTSATQLPHRLRHVEALPNARARVRARMGEDREPPPRRKPARGRAGPVVRRGRRGGRSVREVVLADRGRRRDRRVGARRRRATVTPAASVPSAALLPNFVVIGAMRSGSTSLYKYLQAHPDVFMPRKEIHFFDVKWDRGIAWYHTRFEGYAGQTAIGEATPTYLADPVALDRMAATIPDARLVAVLRDPIDRAYSHYWMEHAPRARSADVRRGGRRRTRTTARGSGLRLPRARTVRAPARAGVREIPATARPRRALRRPPRPAPRHLRRDVSVPRDRRRVRPAADRGTGQPVRGVPVDAGAEPAPFPPLDVADRTHRRKAQRSRRCDMSRCRPRPDPNWPGTSAPTTNRLPIGSGGTSRCGAHRDRGHTRL